MRYFLFFLFIIPLVSLGQVGIGTTTPCDASMLEISGSADGVNYKGLIPPRLPSQAYKANINPATTDIGLMIFVEDTGTLEMWNGTAWEVAYTLMTTIVTAAAQDFDTNTTWTYAATPAFYLFPDLPDRDVWSPITTFNQVAADNDIDTMTQTFLGCRDLNNANGGTPAAHVMIFDPVSVSALSNIKIAFDYNVFGFDGGDDVVYTYTIDGTPTTVVLVSGMNEGGVTAEGTVVINIPNGTTTVSFELSVKQNGNEDYAGFDNFRVYGQ
ncbi:MAG: hypothetical protein ACI825_000259 [Planctomycetota bacterium]|jgi:hypothetical protein|uniref:hypothetical protein n=1 Tax=Patiriisocius sp. Uisw_047 TaxID=3230969 RepID=UPI0039EA3354